MIEIVILNLLIVKIIDLIEIFETYLNIEIVVIV